MNEPLDILLKNRIAEVFENYSDDSANAGWALLRETYPEKKKDRGMIWWYSAAAGLLVFLGLFLLLKQDTQTVAYQPANKNKTSITKQPAVNKDSIGNGDLSAKAVGHDKLGEQLGYDNLVPRTGKKNSLNDQGLEIQSIKPKPGLALSFNQLTAAKPSGQSIAPQSGAGNDMREKLGISLAETPVAIQQQVAANPVADSVPVIAKASRSEKSAPVVLGDKPADPVLKMMADDKTRQAGTHALNTRKKESVIMLSPYAATYFNYAKGSSNQVNVGAGITTDFKISSRVKFSTGVAIAQNTLIFSESYVPLAAASAAYANVVVSSPASTSVSVPPGMQASPAGFSFFLNNYKANLIGLDIPINIKYQVSQIISVSAGVSSGTFLNETYTTTFFNGGTNANSALSNSQHFGTFDFAKTINLSFGMGYPIGTNRVIVEPFLKYPLGGLGSQNIRFGASGINFKLSIGNTKK